MKRRRIWIYDSSYNRWLRLTLDFRSRPFIGHVNIFGPLIGAATHERNSVDNRLDNLFFYLLCLIVRCFHFFIPESLAIPYLELIVVGILLPRMIFHFSAKKCLNNPRKSSTRLYIGICCFFSRIFGVFYRFSCGFGQIFYRFLNRVLAFTI